MWREQFLDPFLSFVVVVVVLVTSSSCVRLNSSSTSTSSSCVRPSGSSTGVISVLLFLLLAWPATSAPSAASSLAPASAAAAPAASATGGVSARHRCKNELMSWRAVRGARKMAPFAFLTYSTAKWHNKFRHISCQICGPTVTFCQDINAMKMKDKCAGSKQPWMTLDIVPAHAVNGRRYLCLAAKKNGDRCQRSNLSTLTLLRDVRLSPLLRSHNFV